MSSSISPSSIAKGSRKYHSGHGSTFESEAIEGALPIGRNNPQQVNFGLYAEQLNGTAFTVPRHDNQRSWLYRIRPSACHPPFTRLNTKGGHHLVSSFAVPLNDGENSSVECLSTPNQLRWSPFEYPKDGESLDFVEGLKTVCGQGDPSQRTGLAIHVYTCTKSMENKALQNSDGDFLFVLQEGDLEFKTEFGIIDAKPGEIVVIPRGIRFSVKFQQGTTKARGYVLEVYDRHFELPDLGPIGSNGLANARDFLYPVASFVDLDASTNSPSYEIVNKYQNRLFTTTQPHSPFDVVAWHGNYAPYKYDLARFNTINTVSFDHPDPSIFTVLTVKGGQAGVALADFVIFPPRWMVAEDTFRPPWFHRNCMAEFMGLISGSYDAKKEGFTPGGASLHSIMTPHGPDSDVFEAASKEVLKPFKMRPDGLAFMFETFQFLSVSKWAQGISTTLDNLGGTATGVVEEGSKSLQKDYYKCWQGMKKNFVDPRKK